MYANSKENAVYVCDGHNFKKFSLSGLGSVHEPVLSCYALKTARPYAKSGLYWIDSDGVAGPETSFQTWCDQEIEGGGWTLAIRGTLDQSYNNSFDKPLTAPNGFMPAFNRINFKDVMVKLGDYKQQYHWAVFNKTGTGKDTLDARIRGCCTGKYGVDYNVNIQHPATARSKSLENDQEMEALSLRMSQTAGPNDAMFFVVGRKDRTACNDYNANRTTNKSCIGVLLGFGANNYTWGSWETRTDWKTTCTYAGYSDGIKSSSCTPHGAVFVR